jgi:transposase
VASEPEALLAVLKNLAYHFKRIGLEAGPLSQRALVGGVAVAHAAIPRSLIEKQDRFDSAWPRAAACRLRSIY